ncbi:MAG: Bax inhibitor-1/YccA family protein [Rickettsiaceae bacterium]|nr:Bax inhibitor-1/YccA family protein [Rickettsiaceae bacterium]
MIDYTKTYYDTKKGLDVGLRAYMLKVYNYMAIALLMSAFSAYLASSFEPVTRLLFNVTPSGQFMGNTGLGTIVMFAPIGVALYFGFGLANHSIAKARMLFWIYATLVGLSFGQLGLIYTGESLARTFLITAGLFGGMSLYGYTTKKDLTSFGSFLIMGVWGIILASLANMFFQSPAIEFATSLIGVFIFIGLIAFDTQKIKSIYYSVGGDAVGEKMAIVAALNLYLDIINLFLYLLRFMGNRRN